MIGVGLDAFVWVEEGGLIGIQLQGFDLDGRAPILEGASN